MAIPLRLHPVATVFSAQEAHCDHTLGYVQVHRSVGRRIDSKNGHDPCSNIVGIVVAKVIVVYLKLSCIHVHVSGLSLPAIKYVGIVIAIHCQEGTRGCVFKVGGDTD
jgi:hypothetical protein